MAGFVGVDLPVGPGPPGLRPAFVAAEWNRSGRIRDYWEMDCGIVREALSARIDGEREPIPAARVDEHLAGCGSCQDWHAAAVEQTQVLRRMAGRAQLAALRPPMDELIEGADRRPVSWRRWALGAVGVVQLGLAVAQGVGVDLGVPHAASAGHVLNEATAWSAALGVVMLAAAFRPVMAGGLLWVLATFAGLLLLYEVIDVGEGRVTLDRPLTHLPVVVGAVLAYLVWRRDRQDGGDHPDHTAVVGSGDPVSDGIVSDGPVSDGIALPENASRGRRRAHLRPADGSAA
jgi:predicted anti-sigma-YlaC factor YlaD